MPFAGGIAEHKQIPLRIVEVIRRRRLPTLFCHTGRGTLPLCCVDFLQSLNARLTDASFTLREVEKGFA